MRPDILVVGVPSFGAVGYDIVDPIRPLLDGVPVIPLLEAGHAFAGSWAEAFMTPPSTPRKLLSGGQTAVHLLPKAVALLALFIPNPGQVLTRQAIMKALWDTLCRRYPHAEHPHSLAPPED